MNSNRLQTKFICISALDGVHVSRNTIRAHRLLAYKKYQFGIDSAVRRLRAKRKADLRMLRDMATPSLIEIKAKEDRATIVTKAKHQTVQPILRKYTTIPSFTLFKDCIYSVQERVLLSLRHYLGG